MTATFTPEAPLQADRNTGDEAVEQLRQSDRSATARIFAAVSLLDSSPLDIEAVIVSYARAAGTDDPMLSSPVLDELDRLCSAAREQGYDVDYARVRKRAIPSTRTQALAAARRLRQSPTLPPQERTDRLQSFVCQARRSGIDISMADFEGVPGADEESGEATDNTTHALVPGGGTERPEPPVAETASTVATVPEERSPITAEPSSGGQTGRKSGDGTARLCGSEQSVKQHGPVAVDGGEMPSGSGSIENTPAMEPSKTSEADNRTIDSGETDSNLSDKAEPESETSLSDESERQTGPNTEDGTEESAFVWPADDSTESIDPDVRPTVRVDSDSPDSSDERESTAALIVDSETTDTTGPEPSPVESLDIRQNDTVPQVRIVEKRPESTGTPDARALTESLSATGTTVPDAFEMGASDEGTSQNCQLIRQS